MLVVEVVNYCSLLLLSCLCYLAYVRLGSPREQATGNPTFVAFQWRYVAVYLVVLLADWMQGPYLYRMYHYHGCVCVCHCMCVCILSMK